MNSVSKMVVDTHDDGSFGVLKVKVPQDITTAMAFMVDQVDARFVDETMLGSYEYIPIAFMISKIV